MKTKKFISETGTDYTDYIKNEQDEKDFYRICELENGCKGVLLKDCVYLVAECMNLDRKLRFGNLGKPVGKVIVQGNPKLN